MAHYYNRDGLLIDKVPMTSKAGYRGTNIGDARKLKLYPSVTTILQLLDKPELRQWHSEQVIKATVETTSYPDEGYGELVRRILQRADEERERAASAGTAIHSCIERLLRGQIVDPVSDGILAVRTAADAIIHLEENGFECEEPEHTFIAEHLGFAGTVDWIGTYQGEPCILDFKTREWTESEVPQFHEPEYPLQLAGYAIGTGLRSHLRASVLINRARLHSYHIRFWGEKNGWPNQRADDGFLTLLYLWKLLKNYWPEQEDA